MAMVDLPQIQARGDKSLDEYVRYLADMVAILQEELMNVLEGRIDSRNMREIAGFNVNLTELLHKSGIVGMSGADPTNPEAVRIWAGDAVKEDAPFRVTQEGAGYASDFTVEGGVIRTAGEGNQRIELSGGSFKGVTADNKLSGLVFNPQKASDIVDLFLYHRNVKLAEFFDNVTGYKIRGVSGATGFFLGGTGCPTYAEGTWSFSSASVSGLPQSSITNLESRLASIESRLAAGGL